MTSGRQEQYSGTKDVEPHLQLDAKKRGDYLEQHVDGFEGPSEIKRFKGGQSNPTYQLITPGRRYVLRRKPPGELLPSAHAVDREFRIIKALHGVGFPVPTPYVLCEDTSVTGTMFYVMDFVDGRVYWDPAMPELDAGLRREAFADMANTMARLHSYDPSAIGLADYGRPGNYFARQISRWGRFATAV